MISEILLGLILIVLIFIAIMIWAIGEKLSEK
jgi:cbb3-type cytochrome oxidase subunit 3